MAEANLARRGVISVSFIAGGCAWLRRAGRRRITLASAIVVTAGLLTTWGVVTPAAAATRLAVKTTSLPAATAGVSYSAKLAASGGIAPYTWSVTQGTLPAGLTLVPTTGLIAGIPAPGSTASFTVQVSDSEHPSASASKNLSITVNAGPAGTFNVGSGPDAIASDGTNLWVANSGSNNVTELSPAGAVLGTFAVGSGPDAIASDGTNMWVTDSGSNDVTELSPAGAVLGTFAVGTRPAGIAYARTTHTMWVTNSGSNSVTELG